MPSIRTTDVPTKLVPVTLSVKLPGPTAIDAGAIAVSVGAAGAAITDTGSPFDVPPPGVVEASFSHTMSSTSPGLLQWVSTMTGDYELAKDTSALVAAQWFFKTVRDRIGNLAASYKNVPPDLFKGEKNPAQSIFRDDQTGELHLASPLLVWERGMGA